MMDREMILDPAAIAELNRLSAIPGALEGRDLRPLPSDLLWDAVVAGQDTARSLGEALVPWEEPER